MMRVVDILGYLFLQSFLFFFSSRRRHTSFSRDWSSDVCSSDLGLPVGPSASSWLVRTLTTEGMARLAALAYDRIEASPEGGGTGSPVEREGTSIRAGPVDSRSAEGSHSGRSTARVKSTASPTVTVCANNNQSERSMERTTKRPAGRPTRPAEPRQVGIAELAERVGRWLEVE